MPTLPPDVRATVLGELWPAARDYLFAYSPGAVSALAFVSWPGLTFLMFSSGMETQDFVARSLWPSRSRPFRCCPRWSRAPG